MADPRRDARVQMMAHAGRMLAVAWGHEPWSDSWSELVARTMLEALEQIDRTLSAPKGGSLMPGESCEIAALRQERDLLYLTLERLVGLKDGPRDYAYRAARVDAWESARRALGMTNQEGK